MKNIFKKLIFIIIICFIVIDVSAENITYDNDYDVYINAEEISNYDLINWDDNDCVLNIRDIVGIGNREVIPSCDIFNKYVKHKDVILVGEEVNSSENIIILLVVLIIIGLIYLIIFDKNK